MKFLIVFPFSVIVQRQAEMVASLSPARLENEDRGQAALPCGNVAATRSLFDQAPYTPRQTPAAGARQPSAAVQPLVHPQQQQQHPAIVAGKYVFKIGVFDTFISNRKKDQFPPCSL